MPYIVKLLKYIFILLCVIWGGFILLVGIYYYFLVLDAEGCTTCLIRSRNPLINRGYYFTNKYIPAEDFNSGVRKVKFAYKLAMQDVEFKNQVERAETQKIEGKTEIISKFFAYPNLYKVTYYKNYGFLYGFYSCSIYVNIDNSQTLFKKCSDHPYLK